MRDCFVPLTSLGVFAMIAALIVIAPSKALEPTSPFIIQDIEYKSFKGRAKLAIETNKRVDYIVYELEDPYRIVIDPLDTVWCDFEEAVYFGEGMVKSIKFIKLKDMPDGPGLPYYPFDFVTVELRNPYPYDLSKRDYVVTLNIREYKGEIREDKGKIREDKGEAMALEDCIQIAMANSLAIKATKERIELAKMRVNEAFRELFPELSFLLDETKGMISEEHFIGRKLGFEFKQVIFHGGEQMYLWEQSKVNLKVAEENLKKTKEELIFEVTKAYYQLAKAVNKYEFQKELLEDIKADFEIVKKEYEFGLISQIDFMNAESIINQVSHTMLSYKNSLSLARLELNKVMNVEINADIEIDSHMVLRDIEIDLNECIDLALKFRPEYRIGYLSTEIAKFTERLAKSQTFPQIDIFGRYLKARELLEPAFESLDNRLKNERILGATVSVPIGSHTIDYQHKRTKLAPTVTTFESDTRYDAHKFRVNLFDNMARYSNVKDASAGYKEALDELNKAEQSIHTDIREAIFNFRESKIKIKNALNNIELYKKELGVARIRKGLNEISFYDLIQAKTKLYGEKGVYTDSVGDYYIAIARVNKAVGLGGYFN